MSLINSYLFGYPADYSVDSHRVDIVSSEATLGGEHILCEEVEFSVKNLILLEG
jgi:hypothetical protein